jgi:GAF domain-containing protein
MVNSIGQGFLAAVDRISRVSHWYEHILDKERARWLAGTSLVLGFLALVFAFSSPLIVPESMSYLVVSGLLVAVICTGVYTLVQGGNLRPASYLFITLLLLLVFVPNLALGTQDLLMLGFALPVVCAALLLGRTWTFVTAVVEAICLALLGLIAFYSTGEMRLEVAVELGFGLLFLVMLTGAAVALAGSIDHWYDISDRITRQLEAAVVVTETAATAISLTWLVNEVAKRIRQSYGFYHVQVFMIDPERKVARLEASTGRAGQLLLKQGHSIPIGSQSVIGQCTARVAPIVVNNVSASAIHRPNKMLPETRAELALPLIIRDEVIGALDVQSTEANAFRASDVRSLEIMANQLALVIEKVRLVEELQRRADENEQLFDEAQRSLAQVEDLNRQMTREGWNRYIRGRSAAHGLGYTRQRAEIRRDDSWTAPMRQAYQGEHSVVIRQDQHAHIAALPLRVRGEVIGVLEIERGGNQPWTEADLDMAEAMVERLGLAVENARLLELATESAEREQIINRIAQEMQSADTIEGVLQGALTELGDLLGASRGIVQISPKVDSFEARALAEPMPGEEIQEV